MFLPQKALKQNRFERFPFFVPLFASLNAAIASPAQAVLWAHGRGGNEEGEARDGGARGLGLQRCGAQSQAGVAIRLEMGAWVSRLFGGPRFWFWFTVGNPKEAKHLGPRRIGHTVDGIPKDGVGTSGVAQNFTESLRLTCHMSLLGLLGLFRDPPYHPQLESLHNTRMSQWLWFPNWVEPKPCPLIFAGPPSKENK